MAKVYKLILVIIFGLFGFIHNSGVSSAQAVVCRVSQVAWSANRVVVGQSVNLIITVNDPTACSGVVIEYKLYERDLTFINPDELILTRTATFTISSGSQMREAISFTSAMFTAGGNEEGGEVYAQVRAQAQSGYTAESGYIYFFSTAANAGPVAACVDSSGRYSCSSSNNENDCSDAPSNRCAGKPCVRITASQCDQIAQVSGGQPTTVGYSIPNVFAGATDVIGLIDLIANFIFTFSIPVMVVIIIWVGIKFVTSRGNSAEIQKARTLLWYALIGLAIVLIGKGFVELIVTFLQS